MFDDDTRSQNPEGGRQDTPGRGSQNPQDTGGRQDPGKQNPGGGRQETPGRGSEDPFRKPDSGRMPGNREEDEDE